MNRRIRFVALSSVGIIAAACGADPSGNGWPTSDEGEAPADRTPAPSLSATATIAGSSIPPTIDARTSASSPLRIVGIKGIANDGVLKDIAGAGEQTAVTTLPTMSPNAPSVGDTAITTKYTQTGGVNGPLGASTSSITNTPSGGKVQNFRNGAIYWSSATGAHEVHGDIFTAYKAWGLEAGPLGYPTSDETVAPDGVGRFNFFQAGAIYWTPSTGAHVVYGAILLKWSDLSFERGFLGYPTTDSFVAPDGVGVFNYFQGGAIYWSPNTGAHEVHGDILLKWASLGWEAGPLGYPTTDEVADSSFQKKNTFERGVIHWESIAQPMTVYEQNMALLPPIAPYLGENRTRALNAVIAFLKRVKPDVVGLTEMFADGERDSIASALGSTYPNRIDGPDEDDIIEEDGGLLLLSKFPFDDTATSIYRSCVGNDCLSNKGIIYARIRPPAGPGYDTFLSHTQNPDEGSMGAAIPTVSRQMIQLRSVSQAERKRQIFPGLIIGDLNADAFVSSVYQDTITKLGNPVDAWLVAGTPGKRGVTSDKVSDFAAGSTNLANSNPLTSPRGVNGNRIDYAFNYVGQNYIPSLRKFEIINEQTSSGRDMSDHYGTLSTYDGARHLQVDYTGSVSKVTIKLTKFHCLEVTGGTLDTDDPDNMEWKLKVSVDGGSFTTKTSPIIDVNNDQVKTLSSPLTITTGAVSSNIVVRVEAAEVDSSPFGETGRVPFGPVDMTLNKEQLVQAIQQAQEYGFGIMFADDGSYTGTVEVRATR